MKNLLWFLLFGGLLAAGCQNDCTDPTNPDCDNYDPCYGATPVIASFKIVELLPHAYTKWENEGFFWEQRNSDTVYFRNVEFEAPEGMDKYTWIIGNETLHDRVVVRENFPPNQVIPITLIVEKTPNQQCFTDDDGIDTLVRNLFYHDDYYNYNSLVFGEYKGHFLSAPAEAFHIIFEGKPPFTIGDTTYTEYARFGNLFKACQEVVLFKQVLVANRFMLFDTWTAAFGGGRCGRPMGRMMISGTNDEKVRIEFRYIEGDNFGFEVPAPNQLFIFEGIRQ